MSIKVNKKDGRFYCSKCETPQKLSESTETAGYAVLPCPFCGELPHLIQAPDPDKLYDMLYGIQCHECGQADGGFWPHRETAFGAWNERKVDVNIKNEIDQYAREAREELRHGNLHDVENLLLAIEDCGA